MFTVNFTKKLIYLNIITIPLGHFNSFRIKRCEFNTSIMNGFISHGNAFLHHNEFNITIA